MYNSEFRRSFSVLLFFSSFFRDARCVNLVSRTDSQFNAKETKSEVRHVEKNVTTPRVESPSKIYNL